MSDYEIITDGGRRRRWSASEKLRIVEGEALPSLEDGTGISAKACRSEPVSHLWRRLMLVGGAVAVSEDDVTSIAVRQSASAS